MKKFFTIAAAATVATMSFAQKPDIQHVTNQVNRYNDNIVVYTVGTPKMEEGAMTGSILGDQFASALCTVESELGTNFQNGGLANGTNFFAVKNDYTDPTTGISFPKGYYCPINASGKEFKLQTVVDATKASGVQNVKKVIVYVAASANSYQPSSYYTKDEVAGTEYSKDPSKKSCILTDSRYTVALNGKIKALTPGVNDSATVKVAEVDVPLFMVNKDNSYYPTQLTDGVPATDWTTFAVERPLRIEIDFTKPYVLAEKEDANRAIDNTGTPMHFDNWADHDSNYPKSYEIVHERGNYTFAPTLYWNMNNGSWDIAQETAGEPIAWNDQLVINQNIKKAGYLLGFAIISGNAEAKTYFASVAESTEEDEAAWKSELTATPMAFLQNDDPAKNIFFSHKMQPELRTMIENYYSSLAINTVEAEVKAASRMVNLYGQEVSADYKGIAVKAGQLQMVR